MTTQPTNLPVPSESPRDLKFNAGKIDEFATSLAETYIDRFGSEHYTIEGLTKLIKQAIYNLGFNPNGSFQAGATLTAANDIIQDTSTGVWYRWDDLSTLPKIVPTGSTPSSTGGVEPGKWQAVDVSDVLRRELASSSGASIVGALYPDGSKTTVQDFLNDFYQDPLLKWPNGGTLKIKQGSYDIASPLILDYANFSPQFPGVSGVRSHYEGENMAETIFNCNVNTFAIQMKGDNSYSTQRVHAYDYIGGLTLKGSSSAYGLLVQGKAYSKIDNITAINFTAGEGIRLENFITSELSNVYSQYNNIGIRVIGQNPVGSDLNAVVFNRVSASNNSKYGILGERWGASNVINGLTCEGNGTMGDSNSGGMLINIQGNITVPAVVLNSPYFELNKGGADLQIVNTSATKPVTVIINGGLFNRGSATEYTTNNISVASAGGKTKVILIGVAFANSSGYIPSVDRPYWATSNNCEVIPIGCVYDDETAMAQTSQSMVYAGRVTSSGQIGVSSPGFTAQTSAAGIYTVTYNQGTLGRDSGTYIVSVTPYAANADVTIETTNLSATAFRVVVRNSAGAGVACGFNFMISRIV